MVSAVDVDVDEIDVGSIDELVDFLLAYGEVKGFGQTVFVFLLTINDTGNTTVLTDFFGSFLAEVGTHGAVD